MSQEETEEKENVQDFMDTIQVQFYLLAGCFGD